MKGKVCFGELSVPVKVGVVMGLLQFASVIFFVFVVVLGLVLGWVE